MKIKKNMLVGFALLSAVGFGLSGCAEAPSNQTGTQELTFMESPNPTMTYDKVETNSVGDNWTQLSEGNIELTLHGSSSCPPIVAKVTKEEATVVKVQLKGWDKDAACTEDYRGFYVTVVGAGDVEHVEISTNVDKKVQVLPKR